MFGANITIGQALIVCGFSITVVFLVLLAISYTIDLTAWLLKKAQKKDKTVAATPAPAPVAAPEPVKSANDTAEIAAIAAAVAVYLGKSPDQFVVRSIRRVSNPETPWSQASRTGSVK